jgi:hypothetical protein
VLWELGAIDGGGEIYWGEGGLQEKENTFEFGMYGNAFVHGVQKEFRDNTTSANHDTTATLPTQLSQNHSRTLPNVWHRQLPYNNAIKELFR